MTFSAFVKILKYFYNKSTTNGMFVLELIDESLEDVSKEDEKQILETYGCLSYNPIRSEETARKYFDGSRKISRQNFEVIEKHFERNKFTKFLKNYILNTDDNFRHLILRFKENRIECDENNIVEKCADIFDKIIASADKEYKKPIELTLVSDEEQETFLDFTYSILQKLIEKETWSFKSPKHKMFKHELYELSQEDAEERFDIAIENYNGENSTPSIKLLIKCKKTNNPISKDELVLFRNKVIQVPGCCKTIFITNSSFSVEALDYAKRMGIGLLRIFDENKTHWLAPRIMNTPVTYQDNEKCEKEIEKAFLQEDYKILNNFIVGYAQTFYTDASSFFSSILEGKYHSRISNSELYKTVDNYSTKEDIPYINTNKLKKIAKHIRSEIYGENEHKTLIVKIENLVQYLKSKFDFSVEFPLYEPAFTFPQKIHGLVDYCNRKIYIYGIKDSDLHLIKFSIAHEISHLILHNALLKNGKDSFYYFYTDTRESKKMETQANRLANYIILDDKQFQSEFKKLIDEFHLTHKNGHYLYLDYQQCNIDLYMKVTDRLRDIFDVSREHIKYRLIELGWLEEPCKTTFGFKSVVI